MQCIAKGLVICLYPNGFNRSLALFVERVESVISHENSLWATIQKETETEFELGKSDAKLKHKSRQSRSNVTQSKHNQIKASGGIDKGGLGE
jgi:hypothetical protein